MRLLLIALAFTMPLIGNAQLEVGLPQMRHLWQTNNLNPGIPSRSDVVIALPQMYFAFDHSGSPFKDVWSVRGNTLEIDMEKWIDNLRPNNDVFSRFELHTIQVARKIESLTISFGHAFRNNVHARYPKGLVEIIDRGNAAFIGQTVDLSTSMDWSSFSDLNLGLTWEFGNLSVGGRIHWLNGIQYLNTESGDISLFTDDDVYQLTFDTDLSFQSSSFIDISDLDALSVEFSGLETYKWFSKNKGFSLDVGASFKIMEGFVVEASVLDMGYIKWKDVNEYSSNGSFTYEGVEVKNLAGFDSLSFDEAIDTIGKILNVEERSIDDVRQSLSPRLYFGVHYDVSEDFRLSAVYANERLGDANYSGYGFGVQYTPFEWWSLGTMVSSRFDDWAWGLNTSIKMGWIELYFQSENILSAFDLAGLGNGAGRVGVNLVFGYDDE